MLAIDEADLVLGFGYSSDLERIKNIIPKYCQTILTSATLNKVIINHNFLGIGSIKELDIDKSCGS